VSIVHSYYIYDPGMCLQLQVGAGTIVYRSCSCAKYIYKNF